MVALFAWAKLSAAIDRLVLIDVVVGGTRPMVQHSQVSQLGVIQPQQNMFPRRLTASGICWKAFH